MSSERSECQSCGVEILRSTADRTGGHCMPCKKLRERRERCEPGPSFSEWDLPPKWQMGFEAEYERSVNIFIGFDYDALRGYMPVKAVLQHDSCYKILDQNPDPEHERWSHHFDFGDVVICKQHRFSDDEPLEWLVDGACPHVPPPDLESISKWDSDLDTVVVVTELVGAAREPVLRVRHTDGYGGWQLYDDSEAPLGKAMVITKAEILERDPSLDEITDLPVGWEARRPYASRPWLRFEL